MVKHTQTIRQQQPTNCLGVFEHCVGLALKGLISQTFFELFELQESWNLIGVD